MVRTPGVYIGQTDMRATINGADWLLDIKTTARQDEGSGIYADSWTLQLAAYGFATETVQYEVTEDARGRTKVTEAATGPWTPPQRFGVIHLRGDEDFAFFEVPVDKVAHDAFLSLASAHAWLKSLPETLEVVA